MTQGTVQPVDGREQGEGPGIPRALRRWRTRVLVLGVLAVTLVAAAAVATDLPNPGEVVPRQIPYRGYLDQNGVPVTNPSVPMSFELYTCESGSDCRTGWVEGQAISVQEGQFTAALGDVRPIPAHLFAQPSLYLQIAVDGQLLVGRQRLLTVPYAQHAATSGFPPGAIIAFGGDTPPAGWLLCDGAAVSRATYPQLFAAIGLSYGVGDNSSTFHLPDLRGRFLRGKDRGANVDRDARGAGQVQDWATGLPRNGFATTGVDLSHTHGYDDWWHSGSTCPTVHADRTGSDTTDQDNMRCQDQRTTAASGGPAHSHEVTGGDPETRPTNVTVNWIIRAVP